MLFNILIIVVSYLLGAVPTAYLMGRWLRGIDLRQHGSGNLGATNAFRVMGARIGTITLLCDIGKGALAVCLGRLGGDHPELPLWAGLAAIAGHNWPIYLRFRGGKGVATSAGMFLSLLPISSLCAVLAFALVFWRTRYVSLSSMVGALLLPLVALVQWLTTPFDRLTAPRLIFASAAAVLVIVRHRSNIRRLLAGEEKKIGSSTGKS